MKHLNFFIILAAVLLTSCSTSDNVIKDDAYYSPYNKDGKNDKELIVSNDGTFNTSKISSNTQYDYQAYYSEDATQSPKAEPTYEKTETVIDTNGIIYKTTETYYSDSYSPQYGSGIEDNYDYYYDDEDESYDSSDWNTSIYFGIGFPYGSYVGLGWNYPYYYSPYYSWYYDWWWNPYYNYCYYPHFHCHPSYPIFPPHYPGYPGSGHYPGGGGVNPHPGGNGLQIAGNNSNRPSSAGISPRGRNEGLTTTPSRPSSSGMSTTSPRVSANDRVSTAQNRYSRPSSSSNSSSIRPSSSSERKSYTPANSNRQVRSSSEYVRPNSSSSHNNNRTSNSINVRNNSSNTRSTTNSSNISRPSSSSNSTPRSNSSSINRHSSNSSFNSGGSRSSFGGGSSGSARTNSGGRR